MGDPLADLIPLLRNCEAVGQDLSRNESRCYDLTRSHFLPSPHVTFKNVVAGLAALAVAIPHSSGGVTKIRVGRWFASSLRFAAASSKRN
jgi:hypothetical protein